MKYVSIDLETTGLNPRTCQILEFGAVLDDLENLKPVDQLPKFHAYIMPAIYENQEPLYTGEPFALQMNVAILKKIADRKNNTSDRFISSWDLAREFTKFLNENGFSNKILVAGKNYATFDKTFLDRLQGWNKIKFHHRVLDPMMLFMRKGDQEPPRLSTCLQRAGLDDQVKHDAVSDALQVVQLIRKGLGYEG